MYIIIPVTLIQYYAKFFGTVFFSAILSARALQSQNMKRKDRS